MCKIMKNCAFLCFLVIVSGCSTPQMTVAGIELPLAHVCGNELNDYCIPKSGNNAFQVIDLTSNPYDIGRVPHSALYERLGTVVLDESYDPSALSCFTNEPVPFDEGNSSIWPRREMPSYQVSVGRNLVGGASTSLEDIFRVAASNSGLSESLAAEFSAASENIKNIEIVVEGRIFVVELNDSTLSDLRAGGNINNIENCSQFIIDNPGVGIVSAFSVFEVTSLSISENSQNDISALARLVLGGGESYDAEIPNLQFRLVDEVNRQYSAAATNLNYVIGVASWPNTDAEALLPLQWTSGAVLDENQSSSQIALVRDSAHPLRIQVCNRTQPQHGNISAHNIRLYVDGDELTVLHAFGGGRECSDPVDVHRSAHVLRYEDSSAESINTILLRAEVRRLSY